jgi:hypothetical protein
VQQNVSPHFSVAYPCCLLPSPCAHPQVLDLLRTLRKDNTGYDLKQLFIGAEGTLGGVLSQDAPLSYLLTF